jgi:hypothetical protein
MNALLQGVLKPAIDRRRQLHLWARLTVCWGGAAVLGAALILFQRRIGWTSSLVLPVVAIVTTAVAFVTVRRYNRPASVRLLATQIEARYPELDGRLLTAVQLGTAPAAELNFLQRRVVEEALLHGKQNRWAEIVPLARLQVVLVAHWLALGLFAITLYGLRATGGHHWLARYFAPSITVTPGDVVIEKGSSLVVLARFEGKLPATVDLVADNGARHISLAKNLADPIFGGSVPEVAGNMTYHVEFEGSRTPDYKVTVFEYPRLERADMDIVFPSYTGLQPKRIEDTRRLTAIEDSKVDLTLQLNKPVASAQLVQKSRPSDSIPLAVGTNRAVAVLKQFTLQTNQVYELLLVDAEGRTNRVPSQFYFEALTNRRPEFHLVAPRGDQRPSPLEEISFEGTVWDDFGLQAYGLGYTIPGRDTQFIELGHALPGQERKDFKYLLRLEDLGLEADQLISWFVWGDDAGPDGKTRRSTGDLFFGEVRPFEEVFREGQSPSGEGGQQAGSQGNRSARMAEVQKQIINATWRLQRDHNENQPPKSSKWVPAEKPAHMVGPGHDSRYTPAFRRAAQFMGAPAQGSTDRGRPGLLPLKSAAPETAGSYPADAEVVRDAQADALKQARTAAERTDDPRMGALWAAAIKDMEQALARLKAATSSPSELPAALAAEQAAYQALLKVQQHEYEVVRNRNRNQRGGGSSREQQLQMQLEEMDLTQSENRYETEKQAQRPQQTEQREQLQVMNRLQELARRQQDLNERLKELQTALQEAKTDQEREEIRRKLKRLQEEERQMLADVDETRQRMDRPENQSQMSEQRKQLDDTREEMQKTAEAAEQGSASQALASGTRAQRQLQQMRDQMRKENSSQFADDLRQMREEARELARQQDELLKKMNSKGESQSLSDEPDTASLTNRFASQMQRMTNLVDRAGALSQQAEGPEPLLSKQLYDTLRKFNQDNARHVRELSDDLLNRGLMPRRLYEKLKNSNASDASKLLDIASELTQQDLRRPAAESAQRSRAAMEDLKTGIEHAAQSVLGDDTAALRLAQQELDQLTSQLQREMAHNDDRTNAAGEPKAKYGKTSDTNSVAGAGHELEQRQTRGGQQRDTNRSSRSETNEANSAQGQTVPGAPQDQNQGGAQGQNAEAKDGAPGNRDQTGNQPGEATSAANTSQRNRGPRGNRADSATNDGGYGGGPGDFDRVLSDGARLRQNPITGDDFGPWSDRLRDVEEMIDVPEWRNDVATAREKARLARQAFRKDSRKPDWAVVRAEIVKPLVEVRDKVSEELARRGATDLLVPIDRDPVPDRYADLVRRYYERLGSAK